MTKELWRLDATDVAAGIRNGEFSSRDATLACLARLDQVNPHLNAIVESRPDDALKAADAADKAVADGADLGPLHGVPVSIKANQDLAGWPTVNGCAAFKDNVANENSSCVQNWLDAGVVVIGRTNTPEFSVRWETTNDFYGVTNNPWNADITPGGSSGGAAASVAAGINPLATGTDLGGSLRQPAQACGVASIRPGHGRVPDWNPTFPAEPDLGFQNMNVNGFLARSVRDLSLGLGPMARGDWRDPWWAAVPLEDSVKHPHKIALITDPGGAQISEQVKSGVQKAGEFLSDAGYVVEEVNPPELEAAEAAWTTICLGELVLYLAPEVKDICGPRMSRAFEHYRALCPDDLDAQAILKAHVQRRRILRQWMEFFLEYPLIVAPVGMQPPFSRDEDLESLETIRELMKSQRMLVVVNALNLPAATVPVGISDGLPQVAQIIGPHFSEMRCLTAAAALEARAGTLTPIDPQ